MGVRILYMDSHTVTRAEIKKKLEAEHEFEVIAVPSKEEFVKHTHFCDFDLYLLSINEYDPFELEKTSKFKTKRGVIMIYHSIDQVISRFDRFLEIGVSGFIHKNAPSEQFKQMIYCLKQCPHVFLPSDIARWLCKKKDWFFSEEEQKILLWIAMGKKNREIAQHLYKSQRAIEYQIKKIYTKLNVTNRSEAIEEAQKKGFI